MAEAKKRLLGMELAEMQEVASMMGMPSFAARQLMEWVYVRRVRSIADMTNISVKHRNLLMQHYEVGVYDPVEAVHSLDGTIKYLFKIAEGQYVEAVYIPDADRATLCVSSQVGCKMHCAFCMTGRQGFGAHLTAADILNQFYAIPESQSLTNVVMMGMGEPLDNTDEVLKALRLLTDTKLLAWSPRRITLSTVGVKGNLQRFIEECDCHLAISLHAPTPVLRAELMPAERIYSITDIVKLLKWYDFAGQRRLSFEYILFEGLNDTLADARKLVHLLDGLQCRINLIRFHAIPGSSLDGVPMERMVAFRDYLTRHGFFTTIRASRGEDIYAACGMLSTQKLKEQRNNNN